jgi:hypothetical protein
MNIFTHITGKYFHKTSKSLLLNPAEYAHENNKTDQVETQD